MNTPPPGRNMYSERWTSGPLSFEGCYMRATYNYGVRLKFIHEYEFKDIPFQLHWMNLEQGSFVPDQIYDMISGTPLLCVFYNCPGLSGGRHIQANHLTTKEHPRRLIRRFRILGRFLRPEYFTIIGENYRFSYYFDPV
jgi:hypothetical protein